jgi:hypothetical protein
MAIVARARSSLRAARRSTLVLVLDQPAMTTLPFDIGHRSFADRKGALFS